MTATHPQQPPGRATGGRIAAAVAGSLLGLLALGLIVAGGLFLWGDSRKDDDGYLSTGAHRFHSSTHAIASDNLEVDLDDADWLVDRDRLGRVRVEATSRTGKPVFVGIAPTRDVAAYLARSAHASVEDLDYAPFDVRYRDHDGERRPAAPAGRRFWAASAHGPGARVLTWEVRDGDWSVVVMNADGSRNVDVGVRLGASAPFLEPAGWVALGGGLILLAAAGGLLAVGLRAPKARPADPAPRAAATV